MCDNNILNNFGLYFSFRFINFVLSCYWWTVPVFQTKPWTSPRENGGRRRRTTSTAPSDELRSPNLRPSPRSTVHVSWFHTRSQWGQPHRFETPSDEPDRDFPSSRSGRERLPGHRRQLHLPLRLPPPGPLRGHSLLHPNFVLASNSCLVLEKVKETEGKFVFFYFNFLKFSLIIS